MGAARSLEPADWIKAAFRALTAGGPQAVRAEKLARDLGVTKGSFYWHFDDLPALQSAMLVHWQSVATDDVIATAETAETSLEDLLAGLLAEAVAGMAADYGGPLAEAGIREWARSHAGAAQAVAQVDQRRLSFLQAQFENRGFAPDHAARRAGLFYATLLGVEILSARVALSHEMIAGFTQALLRDTMAGGPGQ